MKIRGGNNGKDRGSKVEEERGQEERRKAKGTRTHDYEG